MIPAKDHVIEFVNFEKWYNKIHAIKKLDLTLNKGETFALLGPNGSGKSTIIRALAGLHFPSKGKIFVNGIDVYKNPTVFKKNISYMPQRITIPDNLTAREVVTLFAKMKGINLKRVDEILEFVELTDDADRFAKEYSGGMKQRIGLAVTFLSDADIYLLDEPTLNLDPFGMKRLRELILKLKQQNKTFIFASHILEDAVQLADRIGILVDGEMKTITSIPEFNEAISREIMVRVKLSNVLDGIQNVLESAGANNAVSNGKSFSFSAKPKHRLSVIRAVESVGGIVEEIHTEPPKWDALLDKYFNSVKN